MCFDDSCLIWYSLYIILIEPTTWIDVCQSNGNLLVSGGYDKQMKIFYKRESKIVQTFDSIHTGSILLFNK